MDSVGIDHVVCTIINCTLIGAIVFLTYYVTVWALIGLFFLRSSSDNAIITLKDGTVIEASGDDAVVALERIADREKTVNDEQ